LPAGLLGVAGQFLAAAQGVLHLGVVGQRGGRLLARHVLVDSEAEAKNIIDQLGKGGKIEELKEVMEKSEGIGMRTFDSALYYLYKEGKITLEEALKNADSKNNLRLKISLAESAVGGDKKGPDLSGLSLVSKDGDKKHL